MKKIVCIITAVLFAAALFSCSKSEKEPAASSPVTGTAQESAERETAVKESGDRFFFEGVSLILPEGFKTVEYPAYTIAVPSDYPSNTDNITFVSATDKAEDYTLDALKAQMEEMFDSVVDISVENTETDGKETVICRQTVEINGARIKETVCTVFFDGKSVSLTFVDGSGDYSFALEASLASVKVG